MFSFSIFRNYRELKSTDEPGLCSEQSAYTGRAEEDAKAEMRDSSASDFCQAPCR